MPTLSELKDIDKINAELDLRLPGEVQEGTVSEGEEIPLSLGADFEPVAYD